MRRGFLALVGAAALVAGLAVDASAQGTAACQGWPRKLGVANLKGEYDNGNFGGQGLAVSGNTLWRISASGLTGYDISTPTSPSQISYLAISDTASYAPVIAGNTLAVQNDKGVVLVDISDRMNPRFGTVIRFDAWCVNDTCTEASGFNWGVNDIAGDGSYLYIDYYGDKYPEEVSWVGVMKVDISHPASPVILGDFQSPHYGADAAAGYAWAITAGGGKVYMPYVWYSSASDNTGTWKLAVIDAATMTGTTSDLGPGGAGFAGPAPGPDGLALIGSKLFCADYINNKIYGIDVSGTPAKTGEANISGGVYGSLVPIGTDRLIMVDNSQSGGSPAKKLVMIIAAGPTVGSSYTKNVANWTGGVTILSDNKTVMATDDASGFRVLDVSSSSPTEKGVVSGYAGAFLRYPATSSDTNWTYVAGRNSTGGLLVFDTHDKANPSLATKIDLSHEARALNTSGNILAVTGGNTVSIFDIGANPGNPTLLVKKILNGGVSSAQDAQFATIGGKLYMFVSAASANVQIFDMSNPASPAYIGKAASGSCQAYGSSVDVEHNLLYVAMDTCGVFVFDISNLTSPIKKGSLVIKNSSGGAVDATYLVAKNGYAYVGVFAGNATSGGSGFYVVDARTPGAMSQTAIFTPGGSETSVRTVALDPDGTKVYVPYSGGVEIYDIATSADPGNPDLFDQLGALDFVRGVVKVGDYLMMASSGVFEIADMANCTRADFNASGSARTANFTSLADGNPAGQAWNFGDWSLGSEANPSHTYGADGQYAVALYAFGQYGFTTAPAAGFLTIPMGGTSCSPSVAITSPAAGSTFNEGDSIAVSVTPTDFTFDCPMGGSNVDCHGHWHAKVDGVLDVMSCNTSATLTKSYGVGSHVLTVVLATNDHSEIAGTEKSITFTVQSSTVTYTPMLSVPGQARATGSGGANFRTAFWATNPATTSTMVKLLYFPGEGQGTGGAVTEKELTIAPMESVAYADVLTDAMGATDNTAGVIVVAVATGMPLPLVTSRTYNLTSNGTFGQYIPAVSIPTVRTAGGESWLLGLGGGTANRTNVGIVNLSAGLVKATVTVYDPTGAVVETIATDRALPIWSSVQLNNVSALPLFDVKVSADGPFFAYASKLDNSTSDPIFIPSTLTAKTSQWIDGVAAATGVGGVIFKSNLVLANMGAVAATAQVTFTNKATNAVNGPVAVALAAGETKLWSDAISELFALSGVNGTFTITSDQPVVAWARTYSEVAGTDGTKYYGQFIPAYGDSDLIGSNGAIFQGISQAVDVSSGFRTNMGFVNNGSAETTITVAIYNKNATSAGSSKQYTLAAGAAKQVNNIVGDVLGAGSTLTDGYIKVTIASGAQVYAWASMVDNLSNDPTFIRPLMLP